MNAESCAACRSGCRIPGQMAATMKLIDLRIQRETRAFVVHMAQQRYCVWREQVETFKAVEGVRCVLEHVPDMQWLEHFAANEDAFSAVVAELAHVD